MGIRKRFILLPVLLVVVGYAFWAVYDEVKNQTIEQLNTQQAILAKQAAKGIDHFFDDYGHMLNSLAGDRHIRRLDDEGKALMRSFLHDYGRDISGITRTDGEGYIIHTEPANSAAIGRNISDQAHLRKILETHEPVVSDVFISAQGFKTMAYHVPILEDGVYQGSLAFLVPFEHVAKRFLEDITIGTQGYAFVISSEGSFLYSSFEGQQGSSAFEAFKDFPDALAMVTMMVQGHQGVTSYHYHGHGEGGGDVVLLHAVYLPVRFVDTYWSIAVSTPEDQVLGTMQGFRDRWVGIIVALLTATLYYVYSMVRAWAIFREERQRKAAETALRASEERFRLLYEDAPIGYQSLDENGCLLEVNRAWLNLLGYSREEVLGRWFGDFLASGQEELFRTRFPGFKETGETRGIGFEMVCRDGRRLLAEFDGKVAYDEQGRFRQTHCILRDVTEQKQAEQAIQALVASSVGTTGQDFFDGIVERLSEWLGSDGAMVGEIKDGSTLHILSMRVDEDMIHEGTYALADSPSTEVAGKGFCSFIGNAREVNASDWYLEDFRIGSYVGTPLRDSHGDTLGILCAFSHDRLELPRKVEEVMDILASKASAEIVRKRMEQEKTAIEAQLRQAQKMEAIGTLAGGIAHDFNNILAAIVGYSELILYGLPEDSPERYNAQQVLKASMRAKDLVRQILLFSRQRGEQPRQPVDILPVLTESLRLLRASLPTTIDIHHHFALNEGVVVGDPTQIQQVLINLCANGAHAMKDGGGVLTIHLDGVDVDGGFYVSGNKLTSGSYLRLTVSDTGHGMEPGVRERIFDPYFTTKGVGEGSGLGLAVVHGIVKRMNGAIGVKSAPGEGTAFEVYIPRSDSAVASRNIESEPIPTGHECVLWVDDDGALVEVGKQMLERLGYQVVGTSNSAEALYIFQQQGDQFDLVITDFTMPQMTGMDLARQILAIRPGTPIILCTGYSDSVDAVTAEQAGICAFAMKPLAQRDLAQVVRRALDGACEMLRL
jgi:two-component system, cell cycle sensor histidine kinase and response regulator CckA